MSDSKRRSIVLWLMGLWYVFCAVRVLLAFTTRFELATLPLIYMLATVIFSPIAFFAYGWDKRRAQASSWRIAEKTLHLWALLGGWPGAYLGQQWFRHKTQKLSFLFVYWTIVVLHVAAILWRVAF